MVLGLFFWGFRFNRLESWSWGHRTETYSYERHGLLAGVTTTAQEGALGLIYNDLNMVIVCLFEIDG